MDTKSRLLVYLSPTVVVLLITFFGQGSRHVARAASFIGALRSGGLDGLSEYLNDDEYHNATPLVQAVMRSDVSAVAEFASATMRHSVHNSSGAARLLGLLHNDPIDFSVEGEGMEAIRRVNNSQIARILFSAYAHAKATGRLCANIDERNSTGYTLLECAIASNNSEVVALLLSCGADPNRLNEQKNYTPLIWMAQLARHDSAEAVAMIKLLIAAGADLEAISKEDKTALDYAIDSNCDDNVGVAHELIKNGANVNTCDENGGSLLLRALKHLRPFNFCSGLDYDRCRMVTKNMVRMLLEYAMPLTEGEKRQLEAWQRSFLEVGKAREIADRRVASVFQWCEHIKEKENLPHDLIHLIIQIGGEVPEENMLTYARRLGRG